MSRQSEKIAGILGGMGPEATVDLMRRIIRNTPAQDDADHVRCIIDNNPKVPSRIKALIEGGGEDPGPELQDMARRLAAWGADFLCMPCNTAHNYYERIREAVAIPVLNMVELTVEAARAAMPEAGAAGLLASPAVRLTGVYEKALAANGFTAVYPDPKAEDALFAAIKAIKRGDTGSGPRQALALAARDIQDKGAAIGIVACTELGLLSGDYGLPLIDAAEVLARAVVRKARGEAG